MKVARGGGTPVDLTGSTIYGVGGVALKGSTLYFTNDVRGMYGPGLYAVSIDGGTAQWLVDTAEFPNGIAADDTGVYWAQQGASLDYQPFAGDAGTIAILVPGEINARIAVALDASNVYLADPDGESVRAVSKATGVVSMLAPSQVGVYGNIMSLAADTQYLYYSIDTAIMKVPIGGGIPTSVVSDQKQIGGIAVDGDALYWSDEGTAGDYLDGAIWKQPKAGGTPTQLASQQTQASAIAVDDTSVIWVNSGGPGNANSGAGSIMQLTPK